MYIHYRDQVGIVRLLAGNQVAGNEFFPSFCYPWLSLKNPEQVAQDPYFARGRQRTQREAIFLDWAGGHCPKFHEVLWRDAQIGLLPPEACQGRRGYRVLRMFRLQQSQQNIRYRRASPLPPVVTINGFPLHRGIR